MKKYLIGLVSALLVVGVISGCGGGSSSESESGSLSLNLTDSVIDATNVESVYITIMGIQYHTSGGGWQTMDEFEGPRKIDLLDLQEGNTTALGQFTLPSGHYTQIRFELNASKKSTSGCYIEYNDGSSDQPLYVPSGEEKLTGSFDVPVNGDVNVTADFDIAKSIVAEGNGDFKLKPTIRLIVNNQAGKIKGILTDMVDGEVYRVYSYEDGSWADTEPSDFENSVNSANVKDEDGDLEGEFVLSFLAAGTYDLVVVTLDTTGAYNGTYKVFDIDAIVQSEEKTEVTLGL